MAETADRLSCGAGIAAPVVTLGAIFVATLLSPEFGWSGNALSDLGSTLSAASTPATRLVFNGGLIGGGLVGLGFGYALVRAARNRVELLGVGLFGLDLVALVLIGVFPLGTEPHVPVAIAFYGLLSAALWTYGSGNVMAGDRTHGIATVLAGVVNSGAWAVWIATGDLLRPGLALPEIVGAVLFAGWAVGTSLDVLDRLGPGREFET